MLDVVYVVFYTHYIRYTYCTYTYCTYTGGDAQHGQYHIMLTKTKHTVGYRLRSLYILSSYRGPIVHSSSPVPIFSLGLHYRSFS